MMTQPLTGHTNRRCRRFRTNMAIDSFSAALVSFVLKRENGGERADRDGSGKEGKKRGDTVRNVDTSAFVW